jgi:hypothetical protein
MSTGEATKPKKRKGPNLPPLPGQCGAMTRAGTPCARAPMKGRTRCRNHGGMSPAGPAHYEFRHGRYSKYLRGDVLEATERHLNNADQLAQAERIALLEGMLVGALKDAMAGGGGEAWRHLNDKRLAFRRARSNGQAELALQFVDEMCEIIEGGHAALLARQEALDIVERLRKLTESERRRRVEDRTMVTAEEVAAVLGTMGALLYEHVRDDDDRQKVVNGMVAYVTDMRSREVRALGTGGSGE